VSRLREPLALYARIGRTYVSWARVLLPLGVIVFLPLGLVHAIPVHAHLDSIDLDSGVLVLSLAVAVLALAATGLIGEVFYTGVVSIALTHPRLGGRPPSLGEVAREISYGRLIAVDLIYVVLVAAGLAVLFLPGVLIYVYFGLAAPAVEIEGHGVREALRRSASLVRGHFWLVLSVLVPLEIAGDLVTKLATDLATSLLSGSLLVEWLTDTLTNILVTPFYAVAAVLLTLDLIAARDGESPKLHSAPARA
jgi:hypothetical protein